MEIALIGFVVLFTLLFLGVPIAIGMSLVAIVGTSTIIGIDPTMRLIGQKAMDTSTNFSFSVLPLFILMGAFITRSGLSKDLYDCANAFVGHMRGGLSMATIVACGGFSAVSGSSIATAATMTPIAMPSMRRYGYSEQLATGSIAAGGTLGILIPPSVVLVIYGTLTETNIGALFIAAIIPGILGVLFYLGAVVVVTRFRPEAGPRGERFSWHQRATSLKGVWGVLALFLLIMGGMYVGWFTPTEAAGVGAVGGMLFTALRGRLSFATLVEVLRESVQTTAMLLFLIVGAVLFKDFVNFAGLPSALESTFKDMSIAPILVIIFILAIYILLGCVLDSYSMILLTVPSLYPMIEAMGFDLVWYGIIVVVVTEISLITPPIGINVFVLRSLLPEVPQTTIFKGVLPFVAADFLRLAVLVAFPVLSLWLPSLVDT